MRFAIASTASSALLVGLVLSACTSGSSPAKSTPTSSATSSSVATTTPARTSASSTPRSSTSPSASTPPLSKYENDPSVQVMRKFFYRAGRTINTGHYIDAQLRKYITPFLATQMKKLAGDDVGRYYPGPLPFEPTRLQIVNSTNRTISGCLVANGWAENPKTHRPSKPLQVVGAKVFMLKVNGRWLVNAVPFEKSVSCQGVVVTMQKWAQVH